jgi:uncharacterized RDD family membrane protein YckC
MFCSKCGATVADGVAVCPACGRPTGTDVAAPSAGYAPSAVAVRGATYAGFWLRFVAFIIDFIIIAVGTTPVRFALGAIFGVRIGLFGSRAADPSAMIAGMLPILMLSLLINTIINWLYFAFSESSSWQATLGKKALGLEVTDMDGHRVSFARASGRFFAKYISAATLLIGYIIAGFTEKKQALHDLLAGTLVVKQI